MESYLFHGEWNGMESEVRIPLASRWSLAPALTLALALGPPLTDDIDDERGRLIATAELS